MERAHGRAVDRRRKSMTGEAHIEVRKRILSALPESGEWVPFNDLLSNVSGREPTSRRPFESEIFRLMQEGIVGRSYCYENFGPENEPCVGRVYYVWRKTPETVESDRRMERLDREWASRTGGMLGYDREVLLLELEEKERRARG
jgi:hypothetical protein